MRVMKKIHLYFSLLLVVGLTACNEDFLDRYPLDAISEVNYFTTPEDLETYMNSFYSTTYFAKYPNHGADFDSDNQVGTNVNTRLQGTRVVSTSGTIGFSWIRRVNYFLDNYKKVEEGYELEDYQQYLGEAYFFRALSYYSMLQQYGDIQWITHELKTDSPELYNPRDSRDLVATNIISALDTAAMYLTADKTRGQGRVNRWMALLIQSRVALFEGTWQKYHANTPFGVQNAQPEKYLQKAADAALELIESGVYDVYSTGNPESDYYDLFACRIIQTIQRSCSGVSTTMNCRGATPISPMIVTIGWNSLTTIRLQKNSPIPISVLMAGDYCQPLVSGA